MQARNEIVILLLFHDLLELQRKPRYRVFEINAVQQL